MTIVVSYWIIPTALTCFLFGWAYWPRPSERRSGDYNMAFWIPGAFRMALAIIVSLSCWLIWSLIR